MKINFKNYLETDVLNFWLKNGIDNINGGIYTCLDKNGDVYGTDKSVWFQGRALWTYCKAYNLIEQKTQYLEAAKKIYGFLPTCTDKSGRMFFTVTKDGKELQKRRYYYSETFAAIGCAEFYKATKDLEAINKAEYYFETAYKIFVNPSLTTPKINPENAPFKALAPVMIMLNTAQIMYSTGVNNEKYKKICLNCIDEILNGGYINTELGVLLENVTLDGKFFDSPNTRVVNPGHSLECAWFLMNSGMLFGNEKAIFAGKQIIDLTMCRGIDKVHGGIISFTDVLGKPPIQLEWDMKLWWPQCEAIIANRLAYSIFNEEKYKKNYEELLDYAFENFADFDNGEWYGYLHYDNTPSTTLKGNIFKGPFHLPRMLMILSDFDKNNNMTSFTL